MATMVDHDDEGIFRLLAAVEKMSTKEGSVRKAPPCKPVQSWESMISSVPKEQPIKGGSLDLRVELSLLPEEDAWDRLILQVSTEEDGKDCN